MVPEVRGIIKAAPVTADHCCMGLSPPSLRRSATSRSSETDTGVGADGTNAATDQVASGAQHRMGPAGRASTSSRRRVVGLEISDTIVRAAYVPAKGEPLLAEISLPAGAVRHGDVIDHDAVVAALRELWKREAFPTKRVVVGIGSSDVVTRQLDLPDVADRDLRSALRFEMSDMIPFPVADSRLDLVRMGIVENERGVRQARVLGVAALASSLQTLVGITKAAGLKAVAIDLTPFALIRAVSSPTDPDDTEAIVHLGDFSIAVVVHRNGVPQFTRSLATSAAGSGISAELEAELGLIEQYIQRTAGVDDELASASSDPVVSAIRGTLEYYEIQAGAQPITRITLTGHTAWAASIAPAVAALLEVPVDRPSPLDHTASTSSYAAVLGLAKAPGNGVIGPAVLQLLPGKDARSTRRALVLRAVGSAVVTALALTAVGHVAGPDTASAQAEATAAQSKLSATRAQVKQLDTSLRGATELTNLQRHQADVQALEVDWPRILGAIRAGFSADATLLSLTAKGPTTSRTGSTPGSIQLSGQTSNQGSISALLVQLAAIPGVVSPWLASARAGRSGLGAGVTTFSVTMELDDKAIVGPSNGSGK